MRAALTKRQVNRLRASIKVVRQHFTGFDAKRGYSLSPAKLAKLTPKRLEKLKEHARQLRREMATPHKIVHPRDRAATEALYAHTGAKRIKGRKKFVVHTAKPDTTTIEMVGTKKKKRVREVRKVAGARVEQQYFYFANYGRGTPRSMVSIRKRAAKMLKDMPPGYYVMKSKDYGNISVAMHRDELLEKIEADWLKYDAAPQKTSRDLAKRKDSRGLPEDLIGFTLVALTEDGSRREYAQRFSMRQRMLVAAKSGKSVFRRKRRK